MSNLQAITIAKLAKVRSGGGAPQDPSAFSRDGHPFVRAGSLSRLLGGDDENQLEKILPDVARTHRLQLFPKGTVLFAKSGMSATKGYIYNLKQPAYVVNHLAALVPHDSRDSAFLTRALQRFSPTSLIKDQAYPSIRLGDIEQMEILAPVSVEDRGRIAAILDKADALRRKRKRALELLDNLRKSIFLEMFGDPESNPKGWPVRPFNEVVDIDAPLVDPKKSEYMSLLHYGPDRIEKDTGRLLPALTAEQDGLISSKFLCDQSHILYSKIRPYLNKVALSEGVCLCSADVYPISVKSEVADRMYVWHLLRSKAFLKFSDSHSSRANIPKINREQFLSFEAPIPPLTLQREFAHQMNLGHLAARRSASSDTLTSALFFSLQHRAFSGELK